MVELEPVDTFIIFISNSFLKTQKATVLIQMSTKSSPFSALALTIWSDESTRMALPGEENRVLPDGLLLTWRTSVQLPEDRGPPTRCSDTKKPHASCILVWFLKTLLGVICDYSKLETNPFQEFRIIHLRWWTNVPHGHSQEFPNSLHQLFDNWLTLKKGWSEYWFL